MPEYTGLPSINSDEFFDSFRKTAYNEGLYELPPITPGKA
jgi:hypothetical protein